MLFSFFRFFRRVLAALRAYSVRKLPRLMGKLLHVQRKIVAPLAENCCTSDGKNLLQCNKFFPQTCNNFPLEVQQFSARRAMIVTIVDYEEKNLTSNLVKQKKQGKMRKGIYKSDQIKFFNLYTFFEKNLDIVTLQTKVSLVYMEKYN